MSGAAVPRVAVVVPVRDRRDLLARLLAALDEQRFDDFEVVVVDDGSSDGSADLAERASVRGRRVRIVRSGGRGAVVARRLGVEASQAPYLAFTDSDCEPAPSWLAAAVEALDAGADLVHGPTSPVRPPKPLERTMWSAREGLFPTCNVFYRRAAYDAAGGFDGGAEARLGFRLTGRAKGLGFGEDTLLAWRVIRAGGAVRFVPEAEVRHHVFAPDLTEAISRSVMAAAFPGLVREVPELRASLLKGGVFLGGTSRLPLYVLAAAAATGSRRLALAAGAAFVVSHGRRLWNGAGTPSERLGALPVEMALDAVVAGALITGALRHRTLVL